MPQRIVVPAAPPNSLVAAHVHCGPDALKKPGVLRLKIIASDSIFSTSESPWDHVFDDLSDTPPLNPAPRQTTPLRFTPKPTKRRRQAMTAHEISAFDEMFSMIFNATNKPKPHDEGEAIEGTDIGRGADRDVGNLFNHLRRRARTRHNMDDDAQLDRKKEDMELCASDQDLLMWAIHEVFAESQSYQAAARTAMKDAQKSGSKSKLRVDLQPSTYPHIVAQLMRTFRDSYHNPHLALAIFDHARHLSVPSYVFGCTTPAYNELLETRWVCFRDLRGVHDALEEMRVNGVPADARTRTIVEEVRREVGERNLWVEESEIGSGEVWQMLGRIERLVAPKYKPTSDAYTSPAPKRPDAPPVGAWKDPDAQQDGNGGWEFGHWPSPRQPGRSRGSHRM
ncbi:hypothetical protein FA95DRAFT_242168 [Auriscalpium vulgare]|uniref:Uncharacterized protein n=1 Tax=Auriscalpium vulgare TaxID=40419 RepID=A0ACB8S6S3_9AGAM|nr:hypothetical protein FA95DRAFT_242168 [Auriscalpium vulgare]